MHHLSGGGALICASRPPRSFSSLASHSRSARRGALRARARASPRRALPSLSFSSRAVSRAALALRALHAAAARAVLLVLVGLLLGLVVLVRLERVDVGQ